jgi:predicted small metal-binding protein
MHGCRSEGGCAFEVRPTDAEIMRLVADHGRVVHKMTAIPPDMAAKVKADQTVTVNV